jgi:hypothetical protein
MTDPERPAGGSFYYLVSAANDCGEAADGLGGDSRGAARGASGCP